MKLLKDRVACKIIMTNLKYKSIVIPKTCQKKTLEAEVFYVGDEVKSDIKPKDRIIYDAYGGHLLTLEGVKYFVLKEEEILAIVRD